MPVKSKHHKPANDRRHLNDNGLVQPSARVKKQRSATALDGSPVDQPSVDAAAECSSPATPPPALPDAAMEPAQSRRACDAADDTASVSPLAAQRRASSFDKSSADPSDFFPRSGSAGTSTVVKARSLGDIVALLVLLFSLHPLPLLAVQLVFCMVTGPPFEWLFEIIPKFNPNDWLHSTPEVPPLWLVCVTNILIYAVWRGLHTAQDAFLDCAQMIIAVSLGGAIQRYGPWTTRNTSVCLAIIGARYLLHHEALRAHGSGLLSTLASHAKIDTVDLPELPSFVNFMAPIHRYSVQTWLEIHVIAQCINRTVVRHLGQSGSAASVSNSRRQDPEAAATSQNIPNEALDPASTMTTDGRPPGPPPASRDGKEKPVSSGKRRRKQAYFARSQQPFWAALAFEVLKSKVSELEFHSSQSEKTENNKISNGIHSQPANLSDYNIWITHIFETEVDFVAATSTQAVSRLLEGLSDDSEGGSPLTPTAENVLAVKVNSAHWSSVSIRKCVESPAECLVYGKIFGLTASSNYMVEVLKPGDDQVLYRTSVVTRPAPSSQSGNAANSQPQPALRPDSPTTTLKNSIKAAETQLAEAKWKSKKLRKDHKTLITQLEREVNGVDSRVSNAGGNDARQRSRAIQHEQSIAKAERDLQAFTADLDELGEIPEEDQNAHDEGKRLFNEAKSRHARIQADLTAFKTECDRQANTQASENTRQQQRRDKFQKKLQELQTQHDALAAENAKSQQEQDVRNYHRTARINERARYEQNMITQISSFDQQRLMYEALKGQLERSIQELEASSNPNFLAQYGNIQDPYAGAGYPPRAVHNAMGNGSNGGMHFAYGANAGLASRRDSLYRKNRERKSSMLSDASGFTDDALGSGAINGYNGVAAFIQDDAFRHNSDGSVIHRPEAGLANSDHSGSQREGTPDPKLSPVGTKP